MTIEDKQRVRELNVGFTFEDGQIAEVFNPDFGNPKVGAALAAVVRFGYTCETHTYVPFPELSTSK